MVIDIIKKYPESLTILLEYLGYTVRAFRRFPINYTPADLVFCGYLLEDGYASYDVNRLSERFPDRLILIVTASVEAAKTIPSLQKFPILDELHAAWILKNNHLEIIGKSTLDTYCLTCTVTLPMKD